ncbi:hypothetical protein BST13_32385 [Mycobacterium aquaticum]|uniref:Secreted protein n=2 Tax=Mycobacterium aquaticum TaxID=1927124 RepID=A0A1X0A7J2_9MYCO|nr:hypothetical protein BST13_32385 [Mycobacterium aquaticum]
MRLEHTISAVAAAVLLTACGSGTEQSAPSSAGEAAAGGTVEQRRPTPRLAVTYDGGVMILDATTLEQIADLPASGYLRVKAAGDNRHVMLADGDGFTVLDTGTWAKEHGDHAHFQTAPPKLTDIRITAPEPGHVVTHDGITALFSDGAGTVTSIPSNRIGDQSAPQSVYTAPHPHHGVAVPRADGSLVITTGDETVRTGVQILDAQQRQIADSTECPGVHGEGAAQDAVVFGCENGVLVVRGNQITKVPAPTPGYARIGNVAATQAHPVVLGDYKVDKAAKLERPTRVSLIDTRTNSVRLVDLPASYSFRSLARGQFGEMIVLGTDGRLRFLNPDTGAVIGELAVTEPWVESTTWQDPRPAVSTLGSVAYVTDPATRTVTAIDIPTRTVLRKATVTQVPDETAGATGAQMAHQ